MTMLTQKRAWTIYCLVVIVFGNQLSQYCLCLILECNLDNCNMNKYDLLPIIACKRDEIVKCLVACFALFITQSIQPNAIFHNSLTRIEGILFISLLLLLLLLIMIIIIIIVVVVVIISSHASLFLKGHSLPEIWVKMADARAH